ncbi:hypothetical protein ERY430_30007 [Erythrobacter sp. EC-HK427]|nr:hypothetical protein ERY430_30007 [Erythrobacter sp. EC-HK427]
MLGEIDMLSLQPPIKDNFTEGNIDPKSDFLPVGCMTGGDAN